MRSSHRNRREKVSSPSFLSWPPSIRICNIKDTAFPRQQWLREGLSVTRIG